MHFGNLIASGTGIFSSVTSESLMTVFDSVTELVPVVVPVVIAFIGFKKAWGFLKSAIKGA